MALTEITNYIEDDWDDNALTSRTSATEGYFLHPSDNLLSGDVEAGDALKGVYRPDWNVVSGSPLATNSQLEIPDNSTITQSLFTPSNFTTGKFSFDTYISNTLANGNYSFSIFISSTSNASNSSYAYNGYSQYRSDGNYSIYKTTNGSTSRIIGSNFNFPESFETLEFTRNSYGNFELYKDGTSVGTATDTTYTDGELVKFGNDTDSKVIIDNFVVK